MRRVRRRYAQGLLAVVAAAATACSTAGAPPGANGGDRRVLAVATVNVWGSILAQLGGTRVREVSIIANPNTDPHVYEPTPADARLIASAQLLVENGIGYDPWAARTAAADSGRHRAVLDVGRLVGVPPGGNPHQWYSPNSVAAVADAITGELSRLDPAGAGYFAAQRTIFATQRLARYHQLIELIRARYRGVPVGASESIFAPLADALGLDLLTPPTFLRAVSEGSEPTAADKSTIAAQISRHQIKVYVVNRQNGTPDVAAQVRAARARGIPVTSITETLSPASATFQQWQVAQLEALAAALHQATGR